MTLTANSEFLVQLGTLYREARLDGAKSVYVTMKPYDGRSKAVPKGTPLQPDTVQCLFRAKLGNRKISTVVAAKDVNKFHQDYVGVLRTNLTNLEKRKKEDEKKTKAKA
ncbi:unnamed protein product [Auanema sp. JU1783]|nr:unnamed protein product [Auanema sp. JU1783]